MERHEIIVDSPMAANFTNKYRDSKGLWDKEALGKLKDGRHPFNFDQLYTLDSHQDHLNFYPMPKPTLFLSVIKRKVPLVVIFSNTVRLVVMLLKLCWLRHYAIWLKVSQSSFHTTEKSQL
ncbi:putative metallo-beta-lactamase family protein [Moritella sp. PE36]|nr:putative metallo-beta-lactamase family protein [Moritella sp. PE36]